MRYILKPHSYAGEREEEKLSGKRCNKAVAVEMHVELHSVIILNPRLSASLRLGSSYLFTQRR